MGKEGVELRFFPLLLSPSSSSACGDNLVLGVFLFCLKRLILSHGALLFLGRPAASRPLSVGVCDPGPWSREERLSKNDSARGVAPSQHLKSREDGCQWVQLSTLLLPTNRGNFSAAADLHRNIVLLSAGIWLGVQAVQPGARPREACRQEEEESGFGHA